jgi:hypothetical protein
VAVKSNVGDTISWTYNCNQYAYGVTLGVGQPYLAFIPTPPSVIYGIPTPQIACTGETLGLAGYMVAAAKFIKGNLVVRGSHRGVGNSSSRGMGQYGMATRSGV